jgi:excisionase family DNA binding protein
MDANDTLELAKHPGIQAFARLLRDFKGSTSANGAPMDQTSPHPPEFNPADYVSTAEAARRLDHTQSWVYSEIKAGRLVGRKIGGRWRVSLASIQKYLEPQTAA